jgi:hypothetical protein
MHRLNKKNIAQIYQRCLSLIRRKPPEFLVFKKLSIYGWCKYDEDVLVIDHRKDLLRTAYHECIHYLYPEWSETMVIYAESRVINQCSIFENAKFLMHLSFKVYKSALTHSLHVHREARARKKRKNKTKTHAS